MMPEVASRNAKPSVRVSRKARWVIFSAAAILAPVLAFCAWIFIPVFAANPLPPVAYPPDFGTRIIVIDPGHGGENEGAHAFWGNPEKTRNLEIARALADHLERTGRWQAILTRDSDVNLPNSERPEMANRYGAEVYLSLHSNGHRKYRRGFSVVWYAAQMEPKSRALAVSLARNLRDAGFAMDMSMGPPFAEGRDPDESPDYQLTESGLPVYVREKIDHRMVYPAIMPAVLIETHYISNSAESIRFSMDATIERFCGAVERSLVEFLGGP